MLSKVENGIFGAPILGKHNCHISILASKFALWFARNKPFCDKFSCFQSDRWSNSLAKVAMISGHALGAIPDLILTEGGEAALEQAFTFAVLCLRQFDVACVQSFVKFRPGRLGLFSLFQAKTCTAAEQDHATHQHPLDGNCAPHSQFRRDVRRATPATLTGVNGRPTTASAVEMKLCTPGIESRSPSPSPKSPTIPVKITIPIFFDPFTGQLLF
jgi:hypothetical protein